MNWYCLEKFNVGYPRDLNSEFTFVCWKQLHLIVHMKYMKLIIWKLKKIRNTPDQPDSQTLSFLKLSKLWNSQKEAGSIIEPASFSTECWEFHCTVLWK